MASIKNKNKTSIRVQFTLIFISVMVGVVLICIFINMALLRQFYEGEKLKVLKSAYTIIANADTTDMFRSDEITDSLNDISQTYNFSMTVVDSNVNKIFSTSNYSDEYDKRIASFIEKDEKVDYRILKDEDDYQIRVCKIDDKEFIEMIGGLKDDSYFYMMSPFTSIVTDARIANRFFFVVAGIVIVFGSAVIWLVTKHLTKPIEELNDISVRMVNLDFDARYTGDTKNEIGVLGENMNKLSESLEKSISEFKSANLELQKDIEKKQQLEEMRMEFISNVSHELKSPIAIIQGYAEGLKEGVIDDPENTAYYCDVIMDESAKMNQMVRKFLVLNQLEFGNEEINIERIDIVQLIANHISVEIKLFSQNDGLEIRFDDSKQINVWADEYKAETVFDNYFSNAIHYCLENAFGEKYIEINVSSIDGKARIEVFNTGENIPDEAIDRLWEKFYKLDKARTREYGGSGVGLSIVKAVQNSIGQKYGVENRDGGVAFWFELEKA